MQFRSSFAEELQPLGLTPASAELKSDGLQLARFELGSRAAMPISKLALPVICICVTMFACSLATSQLGGPSPFPLIPIYIRAAIGIAATSILIWLFVRVAWLAFDLADDPLGIMAGELRKRLPLLFLPVFAFPVFLASFTAAKSAIPILPGFRFDHIYAEMDSAIFTVDPWQITHAFAGPGSTAAIEFLYVTGWVLILGYSKAMVPLFADRHKVGVFYVAMLGTWFLGGFVFAYLFSAAGPTFAHLVSPELAERFLPLKLQLATILPSTSPFISGPLYLESGLASGTAGAGQGISAMPSMHIGAVTIYILASRGTKLFIPAILFAVIIIIGSVHSGFHYFVDAPVAVAIAMLSWRMSEKWFAKETF